MKEQTGIDFQLVIMDEVSFGMELPEGYKPSGDYQFRVSLESVVNELKKLIVVTKWIDIRDGSNQLILGLLTAKYGFEITDFKNYLKKGTSNIHIAPQALQVSFNTITLSTTRGLMYSAFRGTPLHSALLPIIDPANFSTN